MDQLLTFMSFWHISFLLFLKILLKTHGLNSSSFWLCYSELNVFIFIVVFKSNTSVFSFCNSEFCSITSQSILLFCSIFLSSVVYFFSVLRHLFDVYLNCLYVCHSLFSFFLYSLGWGLNLHLFFGHLYLRLVFLNLGQGVVVLGIISKFVISACSIILFCCIHIIMVERWMEV